MIFLFIGFKVSAKLKAAEEEKNSLENRLEIEMQSRRDMEGRCGKEPDERNPMKMLKRNGVLPNVPPWQSVCRGVKKQHLYISLLIYPILILCTERILDLERKAESLNSDKMKAERQNSEAQTKLDVLSNYFKQKELELQRWGEGTSQKSLCHLKVWNSETIEFDN